ncbi:DNA replication complex GINS protein [Wickerhamomyces ciferrii]|uniref:DNA replication complex GINS protein SLD5 n=1 Tax=Wickerhamomyces ciferrii (strain ATCC 14091 / BCRC 22168 / CBS 111 / JCM 3599 / NBRC 0793 / NRRL Y-1031 F-60-10) TaxID=1206466 RepID=K0KQD6_WICCF|nr:DNA replication complex GINS protein [Wickerhamomyces ciferrii]CCH43448.1 DNA replication complex GINS protein [Wickerhamomyces ciferrii]
MDVDIGFDDILRDFERDSRPNEANITKLKEDDIQELTQAWISERMSPELLDYKDSLIERLLSRIREQVEYIELNSIELQTQEKDIKLQLMIIESELDRVNFILRSYLRTRNDEDIVKRLSEHETAYMEKHFASLIQLYNSLFLSQLPQHLQALDDTSGGQSMIEEPNFQKPVFLKVLEDIPQNIAIGDEEIELTKGNIYLIRYSAIQKYVHSGDVALI